MIHIYTVALSKQPHPAIISISTAYDEDTGVDAEVFCAMPNGDLLLAERMSMLNQKATCLVQADEGLLLEASLRHTMTILQSKVDEKLRREDLKPSSVSALAALIADGLNYPLIKIAGRSGDAELRDVMRSLGALPNINVQPL